MTRGSDTPTQATRYVSMLREIFITLSKNEWNRGGMSTTSQRVCQDALLRGN